MTSYVIMLENMLLTLLMVSHMPCVPYRYFVNIFQCVYVLEMTCLAEKQIKMWIIIIYQKNCENH